MNILNEFNDLKEIVLPSNSNLSEISYKDIKTSLQNEYYVQWKLLREKMLSQWTTKNEHLMNFKPLFAS
jgi:hypothetical protein